jgi:cyclopropane fatty-acyl-phospholipid synthase-like methyltransferase
LLEKLRPNSSGLDFGCGPGPTLSVILEEAGHNIALYDPIYCPDKNVLSGNYDFITAAEVFEHLHYPSKDLEILNNALKPGGWLGVMTKRVSSKEAFTQWHYTQDPTHVCFWSKTTFNWLAEKWNSNVEFLTDDVAILQKR